MFTNVLTAKQAAHVYGFAGVTRERLPKRFGQVSVFPSPHDNKIAFYIRRTVFESTYGGKLFEIKHEASWD